MISHKPFVQEKPRFRPARIAQRIKEELTDLVPSSLKDPRLSKIALLTITEVEITPDLKHAKVLFSLMGDEKNIPSIEAALNQASHFLRKELMHRLNTKITPHLSFKFDPSLAYSSQIEHLFKQIEKVRIQENAEQ